jgi:YVTN family beta-propeller protein
VIIAVRWKRVARITLAAVLLASLAQAGSTTLAVRHCIAIGGEGGWDLLAVDGASHRVFVSHSTQVEVVDTRSDSVVGRIYGTPGVHGVALAPDLGRGFTSNGRDSSVTVFDLATLAVVQRIQLTSRNPDVMLYDAPSARVFTFNGGSDNATVIDARTLQVTNTIALGGRPEFAVLDAGRFYVNLEDSSAVAAFDTHTLQPIARWPLAPGENPTGLAIDCKHHRLFSACSNQKLIVLDASSGRHVAELPIGAGVDGAAFDPRRGLVFTSNGEGTLTVIRERSADRFEVCQTLTTERGARTLALDEKTGTLYLPTADFGPPPPPTTEHPHPRGSILPGTFRLLVVGP